MDRPDVVECLDGIVGSDDLGCLDSYVCPDGFGFLDSPVLPEDLVCFDGPVCPHGPVCLDGPRVHCHTTSRISNKRNTLIESFIRHFDHLKSVECSLV